MRLLLVLSLGLSLVSALPQKSPKSLLSVFNVVKFENDRCSTTDGKFGTCYLESECTKKGGEAMGECAEGFGVCCKISLAECGGSSKENNLYWATSTALSFNAAGAYCTLELCPASSTYKQIRLDFVAFTMSGPDMTSALPVPAVSADVLPGGVEMTLLDSTQGWLSHTNTHGQCNTDSFTVTTTSGATIPVICGENAGQHMYIESDGTSCVTLKIALTTPNTQVWDVSVQWLEETDEKLAPSGCLQYFTESAGTISSFNIANNVHLANQDYSICIKQADNMCSISYTGTKFQVSAVDFPNNFGSGLGKCNSIDHVPTDPTVAQDNLQLGNDWVWISMGSDPLSTGTFDRFCGVELHANAADSTPTVITSSKTPFVVGVMFDDSEAAGTFAELGDNTNVAGDTNRGDLGFQIAYVQNAC